MRRARIKGEPEAQVAYYHCVSQIVDRRFVFDAREKEIFVRIKRYRHRFRTYQAPSAGRAPDPMHDGR